MERAGEVISVVVAAVVFGLVGVLVARRRQHLSGLVKVPWSPRRSHPRKKRAEGFQSGKIGAKAPGDAFPGTEKIRHDRKGRPDAAIVDGRGQAQRRAFRGDHPPVDLGQFEPCRNRHPDVLQLSISIQVRKE